MTITTKFEPGQQVFYMLNNGIHSSKINSIRTETAQRYRGKWETSILLVMESPYDHGRNLDPKPEDDIFLTAEDLLKHLADSVSPSADEPTEETA